MERLFFLFFFCFLGLSGMDLFACDSSLTTLRLVETKKANVNWYIYTHETRLVLLASGLQCKTFNGFQVKTWRRTKNMNLAM